MQAFESGFQMVCGGPALKLFRPAELELLICGSEELDFKALEASCHYEGMHLFVVIGHGCVCRLHGR